MSADAMLALIHAVSERGSVSMECESLKQAQRIKYRFYAFREELKYSAERLEGTGTAEFYVKASRVMVSINDRLSPPVLEFSLKDLDDELIKRAVAEEGAPVSDQEGALNKLLKGIS